MKLKTYNVFGMVEVSENQITVNLTAFTETAAPLTRTIKSPAEHNIPNGRALVGISINESGYELSANEVGQVNIATHPEVEKILGQVINWIKQSA